MDHRAALETSMSFRGLHLPFAEQTPFRSGTAANYFPAQIQEGQTYCLVSSYMSLSVRTWGFVDIQNLLMLQRSSCVLYSLTKKPRCNHRCNFESLVVALSPANNQPYMKDHLVVKSYLRGMIEGPNHLVLSGLAPGIKQSKSVRTSGLGEYQKILVLSLGCKCLTSITGCHQGLNRTKK